MRLLRKRCFLELRPHIFSSLLRKSFSERCSLGPIWQVELATLPKIDKNLKILIIEQKSAPPTLNLATPRPEEGTRIRELPWTKRAPVRP